MINDDNLKVIQPDDWKINMSDAWQVLWWCRYLGLTKAQLETAVSEAGPLILDVKRYMDSTVMKPMEKPPVKPPAKRRTALMAARYAGRLHVLS